MWWEDHTILCLTQSSSSVYSKCSNFEGKISLRDRRLTNQSRPPSSSLESATPSLEGEKKQENFHGDLDLSQTSHNNGIEQKSHIDKALRIYGEVLRINRVKYQAMHKDATSTTLVGMTLHSNYGNHLLRLVYTFRGMGRC